MIRHGVKCNKRNPFGHAYQSAVIEMANEICWQREEFEELEYQFSLLDDKYVEVREKNARLESENKKYSRLDDERHVYDENAIKGFSEETTQAAIGLCEKIIENRGKLPFSAACIMAMGREIHKLKEELKSLCKLSNDLATRLHVKEKQVCDYERECREARNTKDEQKPKMDPAFVRGTSEYWKSLTEHLAKNGMFPGTYIPYSSYEATDPIKDAIKTAQESDDYNSVYDPYANGNNGR